MGLIVVDMQARFKASSSIKDTVYHEIQRAIKLRTWICFLEYEEHGQTYQDFYDLVHNYPYFCCAVKHSDDGSIDAIDALNKIGFSIDRLKTIRIVGVNTSFCIKDTVFGLLELLPKVHITLIQKGCNCNYNNSFKWAKGIKNLCLI